MSQKCKYDATKNSFSVAVSGEDSAHRTPHANLIRSVLHTSKTWYVAVKLTVYTVKLTFWGYGVYIY